MHCTPLYPFGTRRGRPLAKRTTIDRLMEVRPPVRTARFSALLRYEQNSYRSWNSYRFLLELPPEMRHSIAYRHSILHETNTTRSNCPYCLTSLFVALDILLLYLEDAVSCTVESTRKTFELTQLPTPNSKRGRTASCENYHEP